MGGRIDVAFGRMGTGKSRILREGVLYGARQGNRLFVVHDPVDDWRYWWGDDDHLPPGVHLESELDADELAEWCLSIATQCGGVTLVLDEMELFAPLHANLSAPVRDIIRRGRHYNVSVLGASQRPALVSTQVRALLTRAFLFCISNRNDAKWIQDNIDYDITPEMLRNLKKGEFIYWR